MKHLATSLICVILLVGCTPDDGADPLTEDCLGVSGGDAVVDACGVCDGDGLSCDCAGNPNGEAMKIIVGSVMLIRRTTVFKIVMATGGSAEEDACGTCDADPDNDCVTDCSTDACPDLVIQAFLYDDETHELQVEVRNQGEKRLKRWSLVFF